MIDLAAVTKMAANSPLCSYFIETRKTAKQRTAMSWLATCEQDTLYLINQTVMKLADEVSANTPIENDGVDIFDEVESFQARFSLDISSEESEETVGDIDDSTEVMCLTAFLLFWERNTKEVPEEMVMDAVEELAVMAMVETIRRQGLVTISGSGKFFDPENMSNPIKNAKKTAKKILKKTSAK